MRFITANTNSWISKDIYIALLPALLLFFRGAADVTVTLTALAFLWYSYRAQSWRWIRTDWIILSVATCGYLLLISTPLGVNPSVSIAYSVSYLRWPLFAAALVYWILRDQRSLEVLSKATLLTVCFIVFDTFWQFFYGVDLFGIEKFAENRLTGPMRNPVPGNLTLRVLFIALYGLSLLTLFKTPSRRLFGTIAVLLVVCIFVYSTGERMSFVLAITSTLIVLSGLYLESPKHLLSVLLGLGTIASTLVFFSIHFPSAYDRGVVSLIESLSRLATDPYGVVFKSGFEVWKTHLLTGVGPHNYAEACESLTTKDKFDACQRHPHNIYLHWLAETGIIGTFLFLSTLLAVFRKTVIKTICLRQWLTSSLTLATLFVTFWPIASSASFFNNWFGAIIWLGIGWSLAVSRLTLKQST